MTAIALASVTMLSQASAAVAATRPADEPSPTVAASSEVPTTSGDTPVEIVSRRTETATHYRMPDGTVHAVIARSPVRFKDAAGHWQAVDDSLVPASILGESRNAAGPFTTTFAASQAGGGAVRIAQDGWSVGLDMLGANPGIRIDAGAKASYLGVAPDTSLTYEPSSDGLKETVVLGSPKAPNHMSFRLTADGVILRREATGGWVLASAKDGKPVLRLGTLMIADSSKGSAGAMAPRRCATMTVEPVADGAIITYDISQKWLDDPARVFPVYVDPTFTAGTSDTWTVGGNDWMAFGWSGSPLSVGVQCDGESGDYTLGMGPCTSYLKFDTSCLTGKIINAATLGMTRTYSQGYISNTLDLSKVTSSWSSGSFDWYSQPSKTYVCSNSGTAASPSFNLASTVAGWAASPTTNLGVALTGESYWDASNCEYREFSAASAQLSVTYTDPTYTLTYSAGANGTISGTSPQTVTQGSRGTTVTAVPNAGYRFASWSDNVATASRSDTATANLSVTSNFVVATYTITPSAGAHGSIAPSSVQTVNSGSDSATFTMTPDAGYHVATVTVDGSYAGTQTVYKFHAVTADHTISPSFAIDTYDIASSAIPVGAIHGTVSAESTQPIERGGSRTYTITPDEGYRTVDVLVDGASVGAVDSYAFNDVIAGHTIAGRFEATQAYPLVPLAWAAWDIGSPGVFDIQASQSQGEHRYDGLPASTPVYYENVPVADTVGDSSVQMSGRCAWFTDGMPSFTTNDWAVVVEDEEAWAFDTDKYIAAALTNAPSAKEHRIVVGLNGSTSLESQAADSVPYDNQEWAGWSTEQYFHEHWLLKGLELPTDNVVGSIDPSSAPMAARGLSARSQVTIVGHKLPSGQYRVKMQIHRLFDSAGRAGALVSAVATVDGPVVPDVRSCAREVFMRYTIGGGRCWLDPSANTTFPVSTGESFAAGYTTDSQAVSEIEAAAGADDIGWWDHGSPELAGLRSTVFGPNANTGDAGEPVNTSTGNFYSAATDLARPGVGPALAFERTYNAQDRTNGPLGWGWSTNLTTSASKNYVNRSGSRVLASVTVTYPSGQHVTFTAGASGFTSPSGVREQLASRSDGSLVLRFPDGEEWRYSGAGLPISQADRYGNQLSFDYGTDSRLDIVSAPGGRSLGLSYDAKGRIAGVSDDVGRCVSYSYDPVSGDLTTVTGADGQARRFAYDRLHRITSITSPAFPTKPYVRNTYDALDRVVIQADGRDSTSTLSYNTSTGVTTFLDNLGHSSADTWGSNLWLTGSTDALGDRASRSYDASGQVETATDPLGHVTHFGYDSNGNLNHVTDPGTHEVSSSYDASNNLLWSQDADGIRTLFGWDATKRFMTSVTTSAGVSTFSYYDDGRPKTAHSAGATSTFEYDAQLRPTKAIDSLGASCTVSYDASGNVAGTTDALGRAAQLRYDAAGHVTTMTAPSGRTVLSAYDANGNLSRVTDASGHAIRYTYDAMNELTAVVDAAGATATAVYDRAYRLASITDAKGHTSSYSYDAADRLTRIADPAGQAWSFGYDASGNTTGTVFPDGSSVEDTYTVEGLLKGVAYSLDGTSYTLNWTPTHRLSSTSDQAGRTTSLQYTPMGQISGVTDESDPSLLFGFSSAYAYDGAGRLTGMRVSAEASRTFEYDLRGDLTGLRLPSDGSTHTTYTYDAARQLVGDSLPDGSISRFGYDADGLLTSMDETMPSGVRSISYTRNSNGQITGTNTTRYAYDATGRLTSWYDPSTNATTTYAFDAASNLTTVVVGGATVATHTYDAADRMTDPGSTYDGRGNLTSDGNHVFAYDAANRLRLVKSSSGTTLGAYAYDVFNRRILATEGGSTTYFHYQGSSDAVVAETDGAGNTVATYAYGAGGLIHSMTRAGATYYYHLNGHGDITALSNASGSVVASYTYDPWGRVLTSSGTVVNPYRYAGYRYDAVSGLYSCWNRSYAPELGRFLQRDLVPARLAVPETLNRYTYCWGDPVNKVDPTGLACWDTGAFVSGLMLGLTVAVGVVALLVAFPVSAGLLAALAIVGTVGAVYVGVNCAVAVATGHDLLGNVVSAQDASFGLGEVVGSLVGAGVESLATGGGSGAAVDQAPPSGDYVNLASDSRTAHVLSQHMSPGEPGESLFPEDWTAGQIMHHISDIATDPNLTWEQQTGPQGSDFTRAGDPVRYTVDGIRDGVSIRVIVEPRGEGIITGFPRW